MTKDEYIVGVPLCADCGVQEPARFERNGKKIIRWSICVDCYEKRDRTEGSKST